MATPCRAGLGHGSGSALIVSFRLLPREACPEDALALVSFTLKNVDTYFRKAGSKVIWLDRATAFECSQSIQNFTEAWHHASA